MPLQLKQKSITSINLLSKEEILSILDCSKKMKEEKISTPLQGKVMASCFYEPSTRTRLSFESAMYRLGGSVLGFSDGKMTSSSKGESLYDSIKVIGQYVDIIVIRHPLEGSTQRATEATDKPIINAGDGTNQHPTQTLLDLFSIQESQGSLENLHIAMIGDLRYGRTVHSLAQACAHFNSRLYFVSPVFLEIPQKICHDLREKGIKFSFHRNIEEIKHKVDILYFTRIQQERFNNKAEYENLKDSYILSTKSLCNNVKKNLKILHPLPRVNEISPSVDKTPYAYYFQQAQNGLYVRQALLSLLLKKSP